MVEDIVWQKRQLSFLKEKLFSEKTELKEMTNLLKCEQARSTVKMFHHNQDDMLNKKHQAEKRRIIAEIEKLEFEIADLESELEENVSISKS